MVTCNDKHPEANSSHWNYEPPTIEDGASIGSGAILLPGVVVGAGAVVAAGAVVVRSVPPKATAIGFYNGKAMERKEDVSRQQEPAEAPEVGEGC
ncbi:MAG TPA: DapH/DapD/GlmU-related protein [Candidatus Paceibacterota bacterium]